ncbi:hypothetical protein [Pedobacter punctiformis]|uniref:Glycosyltransferase 2-like domain-containing protein n=1 Tax=Pedobacter punctiformis TaxID=3004097 RepID=A0ABT4L6I7_9SPHI|nr:hypothetical protein [Pedobacter sp. HCMS5-2]MCZ4242414.1 hypothetical protein [Pedobacter sp. HCMS5-2]
MENFISQLSLIIISLAIIILVFKLLLALISISEINKNLKSNTLVNYDILLSSSLAPQISLLIPISNDSASLIEDINTFLCLNYSKYEVILITDDGAILKKLVSAFFLDLSSNISTQSIKTAKIKNIYKSKLLSLSKLIVIDKKSNGKFDALNAGLNICKGDYIISTNLNSLLVYDSLLKLSKPIMDEIDYKVIAVSGSKRVLNGNQIKRGLIKKIDLSNSLLSNIQMLNSLKELLLRKMAWSKLTSFLPLQHSINLISKADAMLVGGYSKVILGEDLDLIFKIQRQLKINGQKPKVLAIPDAICWFRASENLHKLIKQKSKLANTSINGFFKYIKMFVQQNYNIIPILSTFFWFLLDYSYLWIGISTIVASVYLLCTGLIYSKVLVFLLMIAYISSIFFTLLAILIETKFNVYLNKNQTKKLLQAILIEPIYLKPIILYTQLSAIFKKKAS